MSSPTNSDYHRHMERRDSASSSSAKRRPRLLRACATEPSLTASTASRGALASPPESSSRRATETLMAFVGGGSSPPSGQSPLYDRIEDSINGRSGELCGSPTQETMDDIRTRPRSERYFSFPRFDTWEGHDEDKEGNAKATG